MQSENKNIQTRVLLHIVYQFAQVFVRLVVDEAHAMAPAPRRGGEATGEEEHKKVFLVGLFPNSAMQSFCYFFFVLN
jgi:hypothetical protein